MRPKKWNPRGARYNVETNDREVTDDADEEGSPARPAEQGESIEPLRERNDQKEDAIAPPFTKMLGHDPGMDERGDHG